MKSAIVLAALALLAPPLLGEGPNGTVPRSAAWKYAAHAEVDGASIGAAALAPQDVHRAFSTDLNRCCLVVEVAVYPSQGQGD